MNKGPIKVSVVIPCRNEADSIDVFLRALASQTFPSANTEFLIADGMSADGTRGKILSFQKKHKRLNIRLIDNEKINIPSGLNRAIKLSKGKFIIRMDAHTLPAADYVARCVEALEDRRGDNVGGVWRIMPSCVRGKSQPGWIARAIAAAAAHPFGVGDAYYRYTARPQYTDTVPFGAFRRILFKKIGFFNERLLANEDYEFNARIRQSGGRIWLDPAIRSTYFARPSLSALAGQYLRYGYWKGRMLHSFPGTLRWRQALPPLFVISLAVLILFSSAPWAENLLIIELGAYILFMLAAGIQSALKKNDPMLILGIPLAISTMHLCWGSALLWGLIKKPRVTAPAETE